MFPYVIEIAAKSFFLIGFPAEANFATDPAGEDLDACPPVFE